jgi:acyl-CoA thioesterase FadM
VLALSPDHDTLDGQRRLRAREQPRLLQLVRYGGEFVSGARRVARSSASQVSDLVVETHCNYFSPLAFPQTVIAAMRVAHLGTSSIRFEIGLFAGGAEGASAQGHFAHVCVDRSSRRAVPIGDPLRAVLEQIRVA